MYSNYSVVKARALTNKEVFLIDGLDYDYIEENYESTGIKLFTPYERDHHNSNLKRLLHDVPLYKRDLDVDRLMMAFGISPDYNIRNIYDKGDMCKIEFSNYRSLRKHVLVSKEALETMYIRRTLHSFYAVYIEPLKTFERSRGEKIAEISHLTNNLGQICPGFYPWSYIDGNLFNSEVSDIVKALQDSGTTDVTAERFITGWKNAEILFFTF